MNAATARSSSRIANTRCIEAERSEKPARNNAGTTEAPMPTPISPEPVSVRVSVGGTVLRSTRIPATRNTIPVSANRWIRRLSNTAPKATAVMTAATSSGV